MNGTTRTGTGAEAPVQRKRAPTLLAGLAANPVARRMLPILEWLPAYKREDLMSDFTAGTVVAIMLIPQGMAYALLAGLPPQMGLYASILPLIVYALFGTSRSLGVGPVAIVSLMVASTLVPLAPTQSAEYVGYALVLSLMSGLMLLALGFARAGFLTNFMSHPVIAGFTTAAALIIAFSQFKYLLGLELARTHLIPKILWEAFQKRDLIHPLTVLIAAGSLAVLFARGRIASFIRDRAWLDAFWSDIFGKSMPLFVVIATTALAWWFDLAAQGVKIVGEIPQGLPSVTMPPLDLGTVEKLAVGAFLIAFVGFLETVSVARTLASKRRQKIDPDQELMAMGVSNIAAAFTGGYPVAGSFSRSVVNFSSGAKTQLAAILTALIIALALVFFTPALYHLPKAVLAAIIVMAVASLVDFSPIHHMWRYMKLDAVSFISTFAAVLILGVEEGILAGIVLSIAFFLWRTSRPNLVQLGRLDNSQLFRDARFHKVTTYEKVLTLRVDMSLYFANAAYLEDYVLRYVADHPDVEHFVLVCSSVNMIDASALETIESLHSRLRDAGVVMHLAAVKSTILRRLKAVDFIDKLEPGRLFGSAHEALVVLTGVDPTVHAPKASRGEHTGETLAAAP